MKSERKNILEPFSKELKVVLLYSIKTVVSQIVSRDKKYMVAGREGWQDSNSVFIYFYTNALPRTKQNDISKDHSKQAIRQGPGFQTPGRCIPWFTFNPGSQRTSKQPGPVCNKFAWHEPAIQ